MTDRGSNHQRSAGMWLRADEEGQTIVIVAVLMVVLLALSAFAIDVGYAYFAHRSLQASADAAALAGAQRLPDSSSATATAQEYGTSPTGKNYDGKLGTVDETVSLRCVTSLPGCDPFNAIVVQESAQVPTFFARVLGIDSLNVKAKATACSYCGVKPADIMLIVDRTGSMCQDNDGHDQHPACPDISNVKAALRQFLDYLDPAQQRVGLALFPPAPSLSQACSTPVDGNYNSTSNPYVVVPLSSDYATQSGSLNDSSQLLSTINCIDTGGNTAYANALEEARAELALHGRPSVAHVIIFFSDGAANIGPTYYPTSSPYRLQPCHQGVTSAAGVKAAGTIIYSIGYDLIAGSANTCRSLTGGGGPLEQPAISATSALQQIASGTDNFYNEPNASKLSRVYLEIAADFSQGTSSLIPDNSK
ncbi:MAG TPA: pilus assembly protein TadG-related protein [Gaiellaceae bacterium]